MVNVTYLTTIKFICFKSMEIACLNLVSHVSQASVTFNKDELWMPTEDPGFITGSVREEPGWLYYGESRYDHSGPGQTVLCSYITGKHAGFNTMLAVSIWMVKAHPGGATDAIWYCHRNRSWISVVIP